MASPLKNLVKSLLQRHLGPWLQKELTVEQLSSGDASIFGLGVVRIQDLKFNASKINEALESAGLPLRLVNLFVEQIDFSLPALYTSLSSSPGDAPAHNTDGESPTVTIHGVEAVLRPIKVDARRSDPGMSAGGSLEEAILGTLNVDPKKLAEAEMASLHNEYTTAKQRDEVLRLLVSMLHQIFKSLRVTMEDVVIVIENVPFRSNPDLRASGNLEKTQGLALRFDRFEFFDLTKRDDDNRSSSNSANFDRIKKSVRLENFRIEIVEKPSSGIYIVKAADLRNSMSMSLSRSQVAWKTKLICYHNGPDTVDELTISFEKVRGGKIMETKPKPSHSESPTKEAPAHSTSRNIALDLRFAPFVIAFDPESIEFLASLASKLTIETLSESQEREPTNPEPQIPVSDFSDPLEKSMSPEEFAHFQQMQESNPSPRSSLVHSDSDEDDHIPFPSIAESEDASFYDANEGSIYSSMHHKNEESFLASSPHGFEPSPHEVSLIASTSLPVTEPQPKPLKLKTWSINVLLETATLKLDYANPPRNALNDDPFTVPGLEINLKKLEVKTLRPPRNQNRAKYLIDLHLSELVAHECLWSPSQDRIVKSSSLLFTPAPITDESTTMKRDCAASVHFEISRNYSDETYSSSLRASFGVLEADLDLGLPQRLHEFFKPLTEVFKENDEPLPPPVPEDPSPDDENVEPQRTPTLSQSTIGREFKSQLEVPPPHTTKFSSSYDSTLSEMTEDNDSEDDTFHDIDVRFWLLKINVLSTLPDNRKKNWMEAHHLKESILVEIVKPRVSASIISTTVGRQVIFNFDELALYLNHGENIPLTQILQVLQRSTDPVRDQVEHTDALTFTINDTTQFNGPACPPKPSTHFDPGIERIDYRPAKPDQPSSAHIHAESGYVDPATMDPEKSGPFSPINVVFEGSAPLPTLLGEQEFRDWRDKVIERSKIHIVTNFKRVVLDISSQQLALLLKVISSIAPTNDAPKANEEEKRQEEYPRSHVLSLFTMVSRISSCQIILKSEGPSKFITKSIELELSGIELISVDGYREREDLSYRCVNIEKTHGYYFDEYHDRRAVLNSASLARTKGRGDSISASTSGSMSFSVPLNPEAVRSEIKRNAMAFRMTSYKGTPKCESQNHLFYVSFTRSLLNFEHGSDWFLFLYDFAFPSDSPKDMDDSPKKEREVEKKASAASTFKFILDVDGCGIRYLPRTRVGNHIFALIPSFKFFYISPPEVSLQTFGTPFARKAKELISCMHLQLRDVTLYFGNNNPYEVVVPTKDNLIALNYKALLHENFVKFCRIKFVNLEGLEAVEFRIDFDHLLGFFLPRDVANLSAFFSTINGDDDEVPQAKNVKGAGAQSASSSPPLRLSSSPKQPIPPQKSPSSSPDIPSIRTSASSSDLFDPNEASQHARFLHQDPPTSQYVEKSFEPLPEDDFDDGFKPWNPFDSLSGSERIPQEDDSDTMVLLRIESDPSRAPSPVSKPSSSGVSSPSFSSKSPNLSPNSPKAKFKEPIPSVKFYHGKNTLECQVQEDYRPVPAQLDVLSNDFSLFDFNLALTMNLVEIDLLELSDSWMEENDLTGSLTVPGPNKIATIVLNKTSVKYVALPYPLDDLKSNPDFGSPSLREKRAELEKKIGRRPKSEEAEIEMRRLLQEEAKKEGYSKSKLEVSIMDAKVLDRGVHSNFKSVITFNERSPRSKTNRLIRVVMDDTSTPEVSTKKLNVSVLPLQVTLDQDTRQAIESFILSYRDNTGAVVSPSAADAPNQKVIFESVYVDATSLAIDYKAKSIAVTEIAVSPIELLNLVSVEGVYISLDALKLRNVEGWDGLIGRAKEQWGPLIVQQAPLSYLKSIRYLRPLATVTSGLKDLAVIPYESYRESGSLASAATTATAAVYSLARKLTQGATEGGARVTVGASTVMEGIERVINIGGERKVSDEREKPASRFANQPSNLGEGLTRGYDALMKQLRESKDNIVAIPLKHYQEHGTLGFVTALAKAVPLAVVKPIRGTTEAASQVFLGARNQMLPEEKKASDHKYYGGSGDRR